LILRHVSRLMWLATQLVGVGNLVVSCSSVFPDFVVDVGDHASNGISTVAAVSGDAQLPQLTATPQAYAARLDEKVR
jgi:hypothetical protein